MQAIPSILTIAGSDSGGGAGIQADLKTIHAHGCYGLSAITALTAQNTRGVTGIHAPPADFVAKQLETVLADIDVAAAKTGMLFSAEIIQAVAWGLRDAAFPLVVDPVCVAQSGDQLLQDSAVSAMKTHIFPRATLLTPNIPEAELFSGLKIESSKDVFAAMRALLDLGPKAVLIKGGHMREGKTVTDWLGLPDSKVVSLPMPRVGGESRHGTGCTLSASIASNLGLGWSMEDAVRRAQEFLNAAIRESFPVGKGSGPVNHLVAGPWNHRGHAS